MGRKEKSKAIYLCCRRTEGFSLESSLVAWLDLTWSPSSSSFTFLILAMRLAGNALQIFVVVTENFFSVEARCRQATPSLPYCWYYWKINFKAKESLNQSPKLNNNVIRIKFHSYKQESYSAPGIAIAFPEHGLLLLQLIQPVGAGIIFPPFKKAV